MVMVVATNLQLFLEAGLAPQKGRKEKVCEEMVSFC